MNNYVDHPQRCFNENGSTVDKALRRERSLKNFEFIFTSGKCINLLANQEPLLCRGGNVKNDNFKISTTEATEKNDFIVFYVRKTTQSQIEIRLQRKDHRIMI